MIFKDKIEQNLEILRELERAFIEAKGKEMLPISFFSSSIDTVNRLKTGIYNIETLQLQMMQEHVEKVKQEVEEEYEVRGIEDVKVVKRIEELKEVRRIEEVKEVRREKEDNKVFADTISRKVRPDIGKSLSLNDRFMFQRDIFHGNANEMNKMFAQLNTFQTLNDALDFLNGNYTINWESDAGLAFRELLDKRFA